MPEPKRTDATTTLQDLKDTFAQFLDERGWRKHHVPRSLAMSIAIEAAELMEHFQWGDFTKQDKQEIADELADILHYCVSFADACDIDIATAFYDKLERSKRKYPVEIFNPDRDDAEAYREIKAAHRAGQRKEQA